MSSVEVPAEYKDKKRSLRFRVFLSWRNLLMMTVQLTNEKIKRATMITCPSSVECLKLYARPPNCSISDSPGLLKVVLSIFSVQTVFHIHLNRDALLETEILDHSPVPFSFSAIDLFPAGIASF